MMKFIKIVIRIFCGIALTSLCHTADAYDPVVGFNIGKVRIYTTSEREIIKPDSGETISTYPEVIRIDANGMIYTFDKIIDSNTGKLVRDERNSQVFFLGPHYKLVAHEESRSISVFQGRNKCELSLLSLGKDLNRYKNRDKIIDLLRRNMIQFVDSDGPLIGVITHMGYQYASYSIVKINKGSCHIAHSVNVRRLDNYLGLGWSPTGHWWITGPIEGTFLRSKDGIKWSRIKLPYSIDEVSDAYVVDDSNIWLSARDADAPNPYNQTGIIHSENGGKTWTYVALGSPLAKEVPKYWFAGQSRLAYKNVVANNWEELKDKIKHNNLP